jgi:hypothetical protein
VVHLELHQRGGAVAVDVTHPGEAEEPAVPAVGQVHAERVRAGAQQRGDVPGAVAQPVGVGGPPRVQHVLADGRAVEVQRHHAVRGGAQPGPHHVAGQVHLPAQQHRRLAVRTDRRQHGGDHPRLPERGVEQAGLQHGRLAPGRRLVVRAPHAHADGAALAGGQRIGGPGDEHLLARGDPAGGRGGRSRAVGVGHLDLVRPLRPPGAVGVDDPGQARCGLADAEGLAVVLDGDRADGGVHDAPSRECRLAFG